MQLTKVFRTPLTPRVIFPPTLDSLVPAPRLILWGLKKWAKRVNNTQEHYRRWRILKCTVSQASQVSTPTTSTLHGYNRTLLYSFLHRCIWDTEFCNLTFGYRDAWCRIFRVQSVGTKKPPEDYCLHVIMYYYGLLRPKLSQVGLLLCGSTVDTLWNWKYFVSTTTITVLSYPTDISGRVFEHIRIFTDTIQYGYPPKS